VAPARYDRPYSHAGPAGTGSAAARRSGGRCSRPAAATATQEERDQYAATIATLRRQTLAQAKPIDYRVYYGDFRDVDGMKFPFRLRRAIAGETIEETTFDRIRINAKIDPRKFDIQKPGVQK
jgi:hypothetical protein